MAANFISCSVDSCKRNAHRSAHGAKGFCSMHYQRQRTHGDPLAGGTPRGDPMHFVREVALAHEGKDCLTWPYSKDNNGYGKVVIDGNRVLVHRHICEIVHGEPPTPTHKAAHSCGKGHLGCINPRHLSWKTDAENEADKLAHGTRSLGERNGQSKLTEEQAREILRLNGIYPRQKIADEFGVSRSAVRLIHQRINWAWL